MRRIDSTGPTVLLLAVLTAALSVPAGCAGPPQTAAPAGAVGELRAEIVIDRTIQTFIRAFRLAILSGLTRDGQAIACSDIPATYELEPMSPKLIPLVPPTQIAWEGSTDAAQIGPLDVPANQKLLVAAEGLTRTDQGVYIIARGCVGDITFPGGTTQELRVDVRATSGAGCGAVSGCEPGLECYQSSELPGGYCAKTGCRSDAECMPSTRCVADNTGAGICARACTNQTDCEPSQSQDCVNRVGPDGSCRPVCVFPLWNKSGEC